ncbi:HU family DNA-binding protein [Candidatus Falkowbacteria bacterium]|nr:HU family DNA-binding protein [Candidatus Falkowbacteria bacterium]
MNKAQLISMIANKTGVAKPAVEQTINAVFDEIIDTLKKKEEVTIAGFGTFSAKERHARMGVNPLKPTEKIQMPATVVPKFKAGKTLKDALKAIVHAPNTQNQNRTETV